MFAIVKIAGQQYRVQEGQSLHVPLLSGKTGDKIELGEVLMVNNDGKIETGSDVKVKVQAEIVNERVLGDKVIAFKMKRRKGFRKLIGHRTKYTQIKITGVA